LLRVFILLDAEKKTKKWRFSSSKKFSCHMELIQKLSHNRNGKCLQVIQSSSRFLFLWSNCIVHSMFWDLFLGVKEKKKNLFYGSMLLLLLLLLLLPLLLLQINFFMCCKIDIRLCINQWLHKKVTPLVSIVQIGLMNFVLCFIPIVVSSVLLSMFENSVIIKCMKDKTLVLFPSYKVEWIKYIIWQFANNRSTRI